jgi:stearoyl-CoA desaturase (delta-9 desaturase)
MFETKDDSRNVWWVGPLAFGEGWHNNHHALPRSVRHGLLWYQLDPAWLVIRALSMVGLAWDLQLPSEDGRKMKKVA